MSGFVLIHRQILEDTAFRSDAEAMAFAWLVLRASWKPVNVRYKDRAISLQRGDLAISVRDMAERLDRSKDWAKRFLDRLTNRDMIKITTATGVNIISICNYDKYQAEVAKAATAPRQRVRQHRDSTATQNKQGNKGTRVIEPDGPITQDAGEPEIQIDGVVDGQPVSTPKKASRKSAPFVESTFEIPCDIPAEPWAAFVAMRKATGKPIKTVSGANGMISMLRRFAEDGHPPGEVLSQSVAFEWQGLFPMKTGNGKNGTGNHYTATAPISHNPMVQAGIEREAKRLGGEQATVQSDAYHWA